jgi:hypothetical protein
VPGVLGELRPGKRGASAAMRRALAKPRPQCQGPPQTALSACLAAL